jgi:catechol 2,3-dioxygenase-like lactoylglutathione lyase family enzyme
LDLGLPVFLWTVAATAGVVGMHRILVTVSDLDRTEAFYRDGLGFETVGRREMAGDGFAHLVGLRDGRAKSLTMRLGQDEVTFVEYDRAGIGVADTERSGRIDSAGSDGVDRPRSAVDFGPAVNAQKNRAAGTRELQCRMGFCQQDGAYDVDVRADRAEIGCRSTQREDRAGRA